ncbi:MAG TPA: hypothetical protein VIA18_32880, partial [Polyangia bacterium]|nr:hypothetical protein [Polyangia bacterium]
MAINLVTYPVAGTVLVNGQPPAPDCSNRDLNINFTSDISTLNDGFFTLPQATTVSDTLDCSNATGAVAVRLPAGSYSVFTQSFESEPNVPNGVMPIQSGKLKVSAAIPAAMWTANTVTVSGKITINGAPPTATTDCFQDQLTLTFSNGSGANFYTTVPCTVATGAFSLQLPPATYTVLASGSDGATSFPSGTMVVQSSLAVSGAVSGLALAATTVPVSGTVTINGAPPVATSLCGSTQQLTITFSDAAGSSYSDDIDCTNSEGTFSLAVAPGTYKVTAQTEGSGNTSFPAGVVVLAPSLKVSSAITNMALAT